MGAVLSGARTSWLAALVVTFASGAHASPIFSAGSVLFEERMFTGSILLPGPVFDATGKLLQAGPGQPSLGMLVPPASAALGPVFDFSLGYPGPNVPLPPPPPVLTHTAAPAAIGSGSNFGAPVTLGASVYTDPRPGTGSAASTLWQGILPPNFAAGAAGTAAVAFSHVEFLTFNDRFDVAESGLGVLGFGALFTFPSGVPSYAAVGIGGFIDGQPAAPAVLALDARIPGAVVPIAVGNFLSFLVPVPGPPGFTSYFGYAIGAGAYRVEPLGFFSANVGFTVINDPMDIQIIPLDPSVIPPGTTQLFTATTVPEPTALALTLAALAVSAARRRARQRR